MRINPEFQRQLYLECSQSRLIGTPVLLWIIFTFSYIIDDHQFGNNTQHAAILIFCLLTMFWGARQSLNSLNEEFSEHTWDTQRLSALSPWQLIWGKLFGSTIMTWYGGLICLTVFTLASANVSDPAMLIFFAAGTAILFQATGLLVSLIGLNHGQRRNGLLIFLAIAGYIFAQAPIVVWSYFTKGGERFLPTGDIAWYHLNISNLSIQQLNLLLAIFWCLVGNYRLMAKELGIRTLPWVWIAFVIFLIIYLGGFIPDSAYSFSLAAFGVCGFLTYACVLAERSDAMQLKRLQKLFEDKNLRRLAEEIPIWCLSLLMAMPFALILSFSNNPYQFFSNLLHFYPLCIMFLILRDCALYLFFVYGKYPQRAFSLSLLSAALLYGIIPGIFSATGGFWLAALSFPLRADSEILAIVLAGLQLAPVLYLLYRRWRSKVVTIQPAMTVK